MILKLVGVGAGLLFAVGLIVWGVTKVYTHLKAPVSDKPAGIAMVAPGPNAAPPIRIFATGPVNVTIQQKGDNKILFQGAMVAGESRDIPRIDDLRITATPWQNFQFELERGGSRIRWAATSPASWS